MCVPVLQKGFQRQNQPFEPYYNDSIVQRCRKMLAVGGGGGGAVNSAKFFRPRPLFVKTTHI